MTTYTVARLLDLWCELGDGLSFDANSQQAMFRSMASVQTFRQAALGWAVQSCGAKRRVIIPKGAVLKARRQFKEAISEHA